MFLDAAEIHIESQAHLRHDFLDLMEALATEVLELEEVRFATLGDLHSELRDLHGLLLE